MKKLTLTLTFALLTILFTTLTFAHHPDTTAISKDKLLEMLGSPDLIVLDVRLIGDYETSHKQIKGAQRTILPDVERWARTIPNNKTIVVYGNSVNDTNSTAVAFKLQNLGFEHVYYLEDGWEGWIKAGYPLEEK